MSGRYHSVTSAGSGEPGGSDPRSSVFFSLKTAALGGALLAAILGGGTTAVTTLDHSVRLTVDGKSRTVHTFGDTVRDVLENEGISLSSKDAVTPSAGSSIRDGSRISFRYGRPLTLSVDGNERQVWVTALSVQEALEQLDIRYENAELSVSRSTKISRRGLALAINTPKAITFIDGASQRQLSTTAITVQELLDELGAPLDVDDIAEPVVETKLLDGSTVKIRRIEKKQETLTEQVDFTTTEQPDDSILKGERKTLTEGVSGEKTKIFDVTYENGTEVARTLVAEAVTKEPITAVVRVGTKTPPPPPPPDPAPAPAASSSPSSSRTSPPPTPRPAPAISDEGVWDALAQCESGGNWSINTGNGYYGGLQFSASTWRSVGGTQYAPLPHQATREQQIAAAIVLRDRTGGYSSWPACSRKLGLPQ
jgi:resuscitation-promoting factor RpfB